jgi:transposase-like protein
LEEWLQRKVQEFIQSLLEEEITELLGRQKSERRRAVDGYPAYRNGYGKERKVTLGCVAITVHARQATKKAPDQAKRHLQDIVYAETREAAEAKRDDFVHWWWLKDIGVPEKH